MNEIKRHTLAVLVDNEAGVLSRVARLFSGKGYNIDSLAVGTTHDPAVSRITIEVSTDEKQARLICMQLRKLICVHSVKRLAAEHAIRRELVLIKVNKHHMTMRLNNVYTVGEYFFLDFSVTNRTNLQFDIDELRFKLCDKKLQKATNNQVIELDPVLLLDKSTSFRHGYRNVVVLKKMTFPNDKVLTIELSESQISGRTIAMNIDYEDVLAADSFDRLLLKED